MTVGLEITVPRGIAAVARRRNDITIPGRALPARSLGVRARALRRKDKAEERAVPLSVEARGDRAPTEERVPGAKLLGLPRLGASGEAAMVSQQTSVLPRMSPRNAIGCSSDSSWDALRPWSWSVSSCGG